MLKGSKLGRCVIASVAASLLAGFAANASVQQVHVSYRPSELTTVEGTTALYERIKKQVRRACRPISSPDYRDSWSCRKELAASVIGQIGDPTLTAMNGGAKPVQLASAD